MKLFSTFEKRTEKCHSVKQNYTWGKANKCKE